MPCVKKGVQWAKRGYSLAKGEGETWLLGGFSEIHALHREIAHAEDIVGNKALHGTGTIVDLNTSSVGIVGRRGAGIVLRVEEARNRRALGAGDPKVARSGTERY